MLYSLLKIILWPVFKILYRFEVVNPPISYDDKRLIICANHINILDPVFLALIFKRKIRFISKKELFENKLSAFFMRKLGAFPVDRKNNDIKALKTSISILKNEEVLGIFPEGTRVKEVSIDNIKDGIGFMAYKASSDILTAEIVGNYKPFRKMKVVFKERISIDKYMDLPKKEVASKISHDVYKSIYDICD
ncbi:lysophospholipid acyltransferase family protein [Peptoniphilaceae bacterium SGI.131]